MTNEKMRITAYIILGTINSLIIIWAILQGIRFILFKNKHKETAD